MPRPALFSALPLAAMLVVGCGASATQPDLHADASTAGDAGSPDGGGPSRDASRDGRSGRDASRESAADASLSDRAADRGTGAGDSGREAASDARRESAAEASPSDAPAGDGSAEDPGASPPAGYALVWEDLFDTGTTPDPAKWSMYYSAGNAGNGLRRPSAFSVHDGMVDVVAQMESGQLVSGGMAGKYSATYGYFEFRVRADADASQATDAVVLTWPDDGIWPQHGENDIYETGTTPSRDPFNTFIHYGSTGSTQYWFNEAADGKAWHVMGMEWTASAIAIYRDGSLVGTVTDVNAIPQWSHHPSIQLDAYKTTMGSPVHMYVDWLRIYK